MHAYVHEIVGEEMLPFSLDDTAFFCKFAHDLKIIRFVAPDRRTIDCSGAPPASTSAMWPKVGSLADDELVKEDGVLAIAIHETVLEVRASPRPATMEEEVADVDALVVERLAKVDVRATEVRSFTTPLTPVLFGNCHC